MSRDFCQSCPEQKGRCPHSPTPGLGHVMFRNLQQHLKSPHENSIIQQKQTDKINSNGLHQKNVTSKFHNSHLSTIITAEKLPDDYEILKNFGESKCKRP